MDNTLYQAFLSFLAPRNAGDMFIFDASERTIERVGELFTLTQDFILTGTAFILVPELIGIFNRLWCSFVRSQRIDGRWYVDPLVDLSPAEDKATLIYQPTVIGLTTLSQGLTYHPNLACHVASIALDQAATFLISKALNTANFPTRSSFLEFLCWLTRVMDRPKKERMQGISKILERVNHLVNQIDWNKLEPIEKHYHHEIQLRIKDRLSHDDNMFPEEMTTENPLLTILDSKTLSHQQIKSQKISAEDLLWLPFWKLKTSSTQTQLSSSIRYKTQHIKAPHLRELYHLLLTWQVNHHLFSEKKNLPSTLSIVQDSHLR